MIRIRQCCALAAFAICTAAHAAAPVTRDEAGAVAARWLEIMTDRDACGAGTVIGDVAAFERDGATIGWIARLAPQGWILVPARRELAPVKAWSERGGFAAGATGGAAALAGDDLADRTSVLARAGAAIPGEHPAWRALGAPTAAATSGVSPLLTSTWAQGSPYNDDCPQGDGAQTFVGCTPLAVAQVMRHHRWPPRGRGATVRWWEGDTRCGGATPGDTLRADYADPYDWDSMPDVAVPGDPQAVRDAVSELCYEAALACGADFSFCGTGASLAAARQALVQKFRYAPTAREVSRFRLSDATWFDTIRADLDAGLPLLYASTIHTMVCDGWQEVGGIPLIHINYGWGGADDGWFALDAVLTSANPAAEKIVCGLVPDTATPLVLDGFTATREGAVVRLAWQVRACEEVGELHVWRETPSGGRSRLTAAPLPCADEAGWVDADAPATDAAYWLEGAGPEASSWYGPARAGPAAATAGLELVSLEPNPCNPVATATVRLARAQDLLATVHDLRGRRVATLAEGPRAAGEHVLRWDGRAADGRAAPSGTYLLRLAGEAAATVRRLTLVR
ncbi:MAG: C10 family peptidase [bacterium]|nr:C10 family peptidase [bacterium]